MKPIYHSSQFTSAKRVHARELLAESIFLSTDFEAVGKLRVDSSSFLIREAQWNIFRSPGGRSNGGRSIPELKGLEAYFNVGSELRRALGPEGGDLPRELLAECVRGIIQAETYLFVERGHPTAAAYEEYWKGLYQNSCRYYTNLDRVVQSWFDHLGSSARDSSLYNRNKSCCVHRQPDGSLLATGSFLDSFHEMSAQMIVSPTGVILACSGSFMRAPDRVCFENANNLPSLTGNNIAALSKKEVARYIGGPQGCNHLVDIVHDVVEGAAARL